ncbi:terpenoid synthase [Artomyces pyxidatus]|uniref:Terpenoid synthase n=1 Tax=Artomyces pyxidatus TaxID=48021 RepID=A0ACB8TEU5_9AGAM|nr:terpenoid synthase [Artomyces pyxidatus]
MSEKFYIPNCLENWKWPRAINPYYEEVKAESAAWARSFGAFSPKAQHAYDRCDFNLLACLAYPRLNKERARTGCDLMNMFFVFDEYSDVSPVEEVQKQADVIMDALRNPHTPRPEGEWVGGEVTRQFWELAIKTASPQSQKRFIQTFGTYTQAVVQQAADRVHHHVRSVDEYLEVRRDTIGAKPSFAILETGMNLPDEAVENDIIQRLSILAIDMILLGNDIASYNLEQARGDDNHNIVTIVMHQEKTDIKGAMDWVVEYHKKLEAEFMELYEQVPKLLKFGEPVDSELAVYVDGLGNWVRASDQWGFESERYFGKKAPEIQKRRWVTLMPKERTDEIGPQIVDGSIL